NARLMMGVLSFWPDASMDSARIGAVRSLWSKFEPQVGGYYANIQAADIEVAGNYGPVYRRLVSIKNEYDPINLFRLNSNIRPTA
ncbi:MAG TPA: BBE domain-containing protein, partial [Steroidobacteraceae bacterium]|nr:BBE domain-containing protein [Steroidobacteraceae bacterium]